MFYAIIVLCQLVYITNRINHPIHPNIGIYMQGKEAFLKSIPHPNEWVSRTSCCNTIINGYKNAYAAKLRNKTFTLSRRSQIVSAKSTDSSSSDLENGSK